MELYKMKQYIVNELENNYNIIIEFELGYK